MKGMDLQRLADTCPPILAVAVKRISKMPAQRRRRALQTVAKLAATNPVAERMHELESAGLLDALAALLPGSYDPDEIEEATQAIFERLQDLLARYPEIKRVWDCLEMLRIVDRARKGALPGVRTDEREIQKALAQAYEILSDELVGQA